MHGLAARLLEYNRSGLNWSVNQFAKNIRIMNGSRFLKFRRRARTYHFALVSAAFAVLMSACAGATRPAETGRPRAGEAPYPVTLAANETRREQALAAWRVITGPGMSDAMPAATPQAGVAPELQFVTETLRNLPTASDLRLPRVGGTGGETPTKEELRESLRRFLESAKALLGVELTELSLEEYVEAADGTRRARYQQRPFDYPLRGGYGRVEIAFTTDRRILSLSSTAIPETDRLRRALRDVRQQVTNDKALASLAGRTITLTDEAGAQRARTIAASDQLTVRDLVIYPLRRATDAPALEFHLAWEVAVGGGEPLLVYVDAVTGEQIAAAPDESNAEPKGRVTTTKAAETSLLP